MKRPKFKIPSSFSAVVFFDIDTWISAVNACNNEEFKNALNDVLQQARAIQLELSIDSLGPLIALKGLKIRDHIDMNSDLVSVENPVLHTSLK